MSLKRENTLRQEAGMSVQEWDDAVAAKRKEGKDAPLTKEGILAANPDAQILTKDGKVYYLSQTDAIGEVTNALDAYRAVSSLAALMGGNELADLRLWQQMDIDDMRIYSFQQISDSWEARSKLRSKTAKYPRYSAAWIRRPGRKKPWLRRKKRRMRSFAP